LASKPPVFKIPPAPAKTKGSAWQQFVNYWSAHGYPALKRNAPDIQSAAQAANIDPVWFAGLLLIESGANYNAKDSSAGAIGIGQVMPSHIGQPVPWDSTKTVTAADLRSPGFNLRYSAYFAATQVGKYGYAGAYQQGYNPGYTGNKVDPQGLGPNHFVTKWNPKYVVAAGPTTPPGPAGPQVPGGTAPVSPDVKDPYVVFGKGGVSYVNSQAGVPKNSLNWFGLPMTRSQFLQYWNQLDNTYLAYSGKRATPSQVAQTIHNGWSTTQVQMQLADRPGFATSPVWKQNAPSYTAAWQAIYGPGSKPDPKALRYAIVHNLDATAFQSTLRNRADYEKSQEFKQKAAALSGTYTQIYGVPDENGNHVVNQAAKNGYDTNQFANYLRAQPQYTSSDEFKSNAMGWAKSMGLLSSTPALEASATLSTAATPAPVMSAPQQTPAVTPAPAGVIPDNRATKGP
jgi:hypothetical protein